VTTADGAQNCEPTACEKPDDYATRQRNCRSLIPPQPPFSFPCFGGSPCTKNVTDVTIPFSVVTESSGVRLIA
jgi:hypothetical protein